VRPFANEPTLELRRADVRESLVAALRELDPRLPLRVPVLIGDDGVDGRATFESTDPGDPDRVVAVAARAGEQEANAAVRAATEASPVGRSARDRTMLAPAMPPRKWSKSCHIGRPVDSDPSGTCAFSTGTRCVCRQSVICLPIGNARASWVRIAGSSWKVARNEVMSGPRRAGDSVVASCWAVAVSRSSCGGEL